MESQGSQEAINGQLPYNFVDILLLRRLLPTTHTEGILLVVSAGSRRRRRRPLRLHVTKGYIMPCHPSIDLIMLIRRKGKSIPTAGQGRQGNGYKEESSVRPGGRSPGLITLLSNQKERC